MTPALQAQQDAKRFLTEDEWKLVVRFLRLTKRESAILWCMFLDERETAIAAALGLSTHTVHSYLYRLYRKMEVNSKCQVIFRLFSAYVSVTREPLRPPAVEPIRSRRLSRP